MLTQTRIRQKDLAREMAQEVELQKELRVKDRKDLSNEHIMISKLRLKTKHAAEVQKAQIGEQRLRRLAESVN